MAPEASPGDTLREEFNRWAEAGRGEGMEQEHLPIVLPLLARMRLAPDDNVLDVGCGAGWLAALVAEQLPEGRVVGIDVSDEMVRRARRRNDELENTMFVIGEAGEIPWDAQFFNQALSVESAYYWPDPARGMREIYRVLREGGSAWVLINFYRENPHSHHWAEVATIPVLPALRRRVGRLVPRRGLHRRNLGADFRPHAGAGRVHREMVPRRRATARVSRNGRPAGAWHPS